MSRYGAARVVGPGGGTSRVVPLLWLLLFSICLWGFFEVSLSYEAFRIVEGVAVNDIHYSELAFILWYLLFGLVGAVSLTRALVSGGIPARTERGLRWLASRPTLLLLAVPAVALGVILISRHFILQSAPIADDESTYVFIARTLLRGRVINPLPGDDEFFANQFIVFTTDGWYGKYPIGHPLVLALGEAVGLRVLVVPLLSFGSLLLTYVIGRRLFGELPAGLALVLVALSPQFLLTSATQLSQPTASFFLLLGLWATIKLADTERWSWAFVAGAAWAYGVLVRPLPGALFLTAAAVWYVVARDGGGWCEHLRRRVPRCLVALVPVLCCAAVILWIHLQQSGSALQSGYHTLHGGVGLFANKEGQLSLSVMGALLRQNLWLFGWPLSFLFLPFARAQEGRHLALVWSLIGAEYLYRILVPKTVVATTGPIYVMEIVPLLALLTASGITHAKRFLESKGVSRAKEWVVAFVLASTLVGYIMFVPVRAHGISLSSKQWNEVYRQLEKRGASRKALVFSLHMAPEGVSWAYFPPPPSPTLDDDIVFVRIPSTGDRLARSLDFWKRRYPTYSAWFFHPKKGLRRLDADSGKVRATPRRPGQEPSRRRSTH